MARYARRIPRIGHSLGPSEERGFEMWAGYEIEGDVRELTALGLVPIDGWSEDEIARLGIATFKEITVEELMRWKI